MTTDVSSQQQTRTNPPGMAELAGQGIALSQLRGLGQGLAFQTAMSRAAMGLPFDPSLYATATREELGLPASTVSFPNDPFRRERILSEFAQGKRHPRDPEYRQAKQELDDEAAARQRYIEQQRADYDLIARNPLTQLSQAQIRQAQDLLPIQQEALTAQLRQNLGESNLAARRLGLLGDIETQGVRQNLDLASEAQRQASASEGTLRSDLTDLVTSGRAASPAQQAIIDRIYGQRLSQYEQDLQRQREDAVRLLPELANQRGINITNADLPDRYNLIGREYLRSAAQGALGLGSEAAQQSLNYPLALGSLNLQQQAMTGQQVNRLPIALATSAASRQSPGLFGYDPQSAFALPLNLMTAGQGGVSSATAFQSPFLQNRLANVSQTGSQRTGGFIPALGAAGQIASGVGGILSGTGAIGTGFGFGSPKPTLMG